MIIINVKNNIQSYSLILLSFLLLLPTIMSLPPPATTTFLSNAKRTWSRKLPNYDIWGNGFVEKNPKRNLVIKNNNINISSENRQLNKKTSVRNGKVLNFFPVSVADECLSLDGRRSGVCLNAYECRIQSGTSSGQCALGFGVCCIFTATCDQEVFNNITYVVSPSFPALMPNDKTSCKLKIRMIDPDITQLRLDFQHFSLGQPNRKTGVCDGDRFVLSGGTLAEFVLCGHNSGQHIYYDVSGKRRDDGVDMFINLSNRQFPERLWEIRVTQMTLQQRAPMGCMQYFSGLSGVIKTFNFADNGRHLANQNYRACIRQETGMCSIAYEPCDEQSFRIGLPNQTSVAGDPNAGGVVNNMVPPFGTAPGFGGPSFETPPPAVTPGILNAADTGVADPPNTVAADPANAGAAGPVTPDAAVPANGVVADPAPVMADPIDNVVPDNEVAASEPEEVLSDPVDDDAVEGSGGGDTSNFFNFNFPSFFSGRSFETFDAYDINENYESKRQSRQFFQSCQDRITLPCIIEDFIETGMGNVPGCEPIHCGSTLCASGQNPCRIETSVTPFGLGIHFGDGIDKGSPEDNIGACIRYNQVTCL